MKKGVNFQSVFFNDAIESVFYWDAVFKDCGVAYSEGDSNIPHWEGSLEIKTFQMAFCIKGQLNLIANEKVVNLNPGELLLCMPGTIIKKGESSRNFKYKILWITQDVVSHHVAKNRYLDLMMEYPEKGILKLHLDDSGKELMESYCEILKIKTRDNNTQNQKKIIFNVIDALLLDIVNRLPLDSFNMKIRKEQKGKYPLFRKFLLLVSEDRGTIREVNHYAQKLNISSKYLSFLCKEASSKTPREWINQILKKEVEHYLQYSDLTIKEISATLKFPDNSLFSKFVKQHFEMTALELRNQLRNQQK